MSGTTSLSLSGRDRALLRAVSDGRCLVGSGCEPVLLVDGLACADSAAARRLIGSGLLRPAEQDRRVSAAELTPAGRAAIAAAA